MTPKPDLMTLDAGDGDGPTARRRRRVHRRRRRRRLVHGRRRPVVGWLLSCRQVVAALVAIVPACRRQDSASPLVHVYRI